MKKVNVRLTDEEHGVLVARARDARRSLQRQIVFELFHPSPQVVAVARSGAEPGLRPGSGGAGEDGPSLSESAPARNVTGKMMPFDKNCRNSDYHWKGPCRFCGGGEPVD